MPEQVIRIALAKFKSDAASYIAMSCQGTRVIVMTPEDKVFAIFGRSERAASEDAEESDPYASGNYGLSGTEGLSWVR